jgi:hypothetical protein
VRLVRFLLVTAFVCAALGLMSGVLVVWREMPDGTVTVAPRVSRGAVKWYAAKLSSVTGADPVGAVRSAADRVRHAL